VLETLSLARLLVTSIRTARIIIIITIYVCFEEVYLLGYNTVQSVESKPTFRRNMSPPSSGSKNKPGAKQGSGSSGYSCHLLQAGFFLGLFVNPEDGGDMFLRNVG
jgi:hypothetical protein